MSRKQLSARQVFERSIRESDVVGAIRTLLELNRAHVDIIVERIPWGKKTSTPGLPDMIITFPAANACLKGYYKLQDSISGAVLPICGVWPVVAFVEVKRPGGKHRPAQIRWIEEKRRAGIIAFFAESTDQVVAQLKQHGIVLRIQ